MDSSETSSRLEEIARKTFNSIEWIHGGEYEDWEDEDEELYFQFH